MQVDFFTFSSMISSIIIRNFCLAIFLETPVSINTTIGTTAHFYCKLSGSGSLHWILNGAELWEDINNRHVQAGAVWHTTANGRVSTLNVTALLVNDNLSIQCVAYPDTRTDPVILRIQGMAILLKGNTDTVFEQVNIIHANQLHVC